MTLPAKTADKLERMREAFDKIDRLLFRLGLQGLQRMTQSSATELAALEQTAHNAGLVNVERQIAVLATHVRRYLDKDPLFEMDEYLSTVNRVWLLNAKARALHGAGKLPEEMLDVIGEARRSYELVEEPIVLQPVGASGWVTDTDFVGITIYFWVAGKPDVLYEASSCKPTMYFGTNPRRLMTMPISDYVTHTIHSMAHGAFEFRNAKLSRDGRLSLHKDLAIEPAPYIGSKAYEALAVGDWHELCERLRARSVSPIASTASLEVLVSPHDWGEVTIDEKNARAVAELTDASGAKLLLEVPLRSENDFIVDNLERMTGKKGREKSLIPYALFGRAWIADGRLKIFPYTAIYEQPRTLGGSPVHEVHVALESLKGAG